MNEVSIFLSDHAKPDRYTYIPYGHVMTTYLTSERVQEWKDENEVEAVERIYGVLI